MGLTKNKILIFTLLSVLFVSCTQQTKPNNKILPTINIDCKASDWDPDNGTFNLKITYTGTNSQLNTSTLDVTVNNRDVTKELTINTDLATGTITGLNACDGVNVFATIKDQTGTLTSASCNLPALAIDYPINDSTIDDPLPKIYLAYDYRTTNAGFSITMDSSDITKYCLPTSTSATCQKPIGEYITPPGMHSIDAYRCFANNGPCCTATSYFKFTPPVPMVNIISPSNYIGSNNPDISVLFSDTTNKLGLNSNSYDVLVDGNSVISSLVTQTTSILAGFPSTPTSFLAQGQVNINSQVTHTIQAFVSNLFYNTTGIASQTFTLDTTPPSINFVQPISGSTSGGTFGTIFPYFIYPNITIPYEVTYTDSQSGVNPSTFNISVNGIYGTVNATPISATGTLPITLPVSNGSNGSSTYTITAQVSDNVGNTATASSVITLSLANIGIDSANVNTSTEFTIPINVFIDPSHPYGLGSYDIYINFDQRIINLVSVSGSMSGYSGVAYTQQFSNPPNYYQTSSGIDLNAYNQSGSGYYPYPVGLFNVANLTFYAAYPGATTLTIIVNSMKDTTGNSVPYTRIQSGSVTVQ